jgi:aquaporin Z
MKKYLTELIGTFFFVLSVVTCANNPSIAPMAPFAIGTMLMVMIYAGGHISGGHYNPAVTLAIFMRGKIASAEVAPYMIAQAVGAVIAAFIGTFMHRSVGGLEITTVPNQALPALFGELLGTFALCYVVLNVATARSNAGNPYFGLAIGFTVTACAYSLGGLSGGAFNPAIAIGICTAGMKSWPDIWIYIIGGFGGAAIAATVFSITYDQEA